MALVIWAFCHGNMGRLLFLAENDTISNVSDGGCRSFGHQDGRSLIKPELTNDFWLQIWLHLWIGRTRFRPDGLIWVRSLVQVQIPLGISVQDGVFLANMINTTFIIGQITVIFDHLLWFTGIYQALGFYKGEKLHTESVPYSMGLINPWGPILWPFSSIFITVNLNSKPILGFA